MKRVKFMLALIRLVRRTQAVLASAGCRVAHAPAGETVSVRGLLKIVSARRRNQHARRVRYPEFNPRVSRCNLLTNHGLFTSFMQSFAALG